MAQPLNQLLVNLDKDNIDGISFVDLKKAFDTINVTVKCHN